MQYLAQFNPADFDAAGSAVGFQWAGSAPGTIITAALPYVFGLAGIAMGIYIVFSGFSLMMSRGDERAVAAAKTRLTNAIIGFIVIFVSYWTLQIVGRVFDIDAIQNIFG